MKDPDQPSSRREDYVTLTKRGHQTSHHMSSSQQMIEMITSKRLTLDNHSRVFGNLKTETHLLTDGHGKIPRHYLAEAQRLFVAFDRNRQRSEPVMILRCFKIIDKNHHGSESISFLRAFADIAEAASSNPNFHSKLFHTVLNMVRFLEIRTPGIVRPPFLKKIAKEIAPSSKWKEENFLQFFQKANAELVEGSQNTDLKETFKSATRPVPPAPTPDKKKQRHR